ncbi:hypothetical protein KY289_009983 [Solanum tuberosum]|nr:hypothetical protein KY289_009983 [Solanum tuberosum]
MTPSASGSRRRVQKCYAVILVGLVPVVPLQGGDGNPVSNQMWGNECEDASDHSLEGGIPTLITWSYGGNNVAIQGSWDNWTSR